MREQNRYLYPGGTSYKVIQKTNIHIPCALTANINISLCLPKTPLFPGPTVPLLLGHFFPTREVWHLLWSLYIEYLATIFIFFPKDHKEKCGG